MQNELNMVYAKMDKMDQDFSDLWSEKKETEERCKMLENELNQRDFNSRGGGGPSDQTLQDENAYLKEQLDYMRNTIKDIDAKIKTQVTDVHSEAEIQSLREENTKLKLENYK